MDNGASSYRRFRDLGDESGLVEIIRDYKDGLIFYLTSIVGSLQLAEEIAEDTFVLLGTKRPRDKNKGSFRTWLYTIGRNLAIDYLRKQVRRQTVPLEECAELADLLELEQAYIRDERKIQVHRALLKLKPEYRQVLWLVYFEDFSCRDAAAVLGKTVHGTEMLLSRARKSLKELLEMEDFIYEAL